MSSKDMMTNGRTSLRSSHSTTAERLTTLDIMKALCILLVVWGHLLESSFGHTFIWNLLYMCHMPCFFLISGFLMRGAMNRHGFVSLLKKRARGLLVPFVAWSLLAVAANTTLGILDGGPWLACLGKNVSSSFLYADSVWFFLTLFFVECWFIVLCEARAFLGRRGIATSPWLVVLMGWIGAALLSTEVLKLNKVAVYFPFFVVGYWAALRWNAIRHQEVGQTTTARLIVPFLIFCSIYMVLVSTYNDSPFPFETFTNWRYQSSLEPVTTLRAIGLYPIALVGCAAIYFAARILEVTKANSLCCSIGRETAIIYPAHIILIRAGLDSIPVLGSMTWASLQYMFMSCAIIAMILLGKRLLIGLSDALAKRN